MRAVRSESVGKKSTQSTQSDQGVVADEGTGSRGLQKQTPVEGGGIGGEGGRKGWERGGSSQVRWWGKGGRGQGMWHGEEKQAWWWSRGSRG